MERRIHILDPRIAEKIAAGEVVERPASVVKELIENSLDAQASRICVTLEDGGKSKIEIVDNGIGMSCADLELCISRHATSKLKTLDDLENVMTLGFRGEALPSVAAVADLSIISRTPDTSAAYELSAESVSGRFSGQPRAEKVTWGNFIDTSHGTRILVSSLFAQVPARLKFLRSQTSEITQIKEWMERLAIAHPRVGFQLISDDRMVLSLQPEEEKARVQTILADGEETRILSAFHDQDGKHDRGLRARVHWVEGLSLSQNRKLIQVVNGRAVRDKVLQQALLGPFRQALLPGQFPALALFLDIHPGSIDVNVHPSKTEIRFLDTQKIFQTMNALAKSLLAQRGTPERSECPDDYPRAAYLPPLDPTQDQTRTKPRPEIPRPDFFTFSQSHLSPHPALFKTEPAPEQEPQPTVTSSPSFPNVLLGVQEPVVRQPSSTHLLTRATYVGTFFLTYFAFELNDELIWVDQHAAHERIRYENLQNQIFGASQSLLMPETVRIAPELTPLIEKRLSFLSSLGFECEFFGEDTLLFRAVPSVWGAYALKIRLKTLVDRMIQLEEEEGGSTSDDRSLILDEKLFEILASEACHSSVRAGDQLTRVQIDSLIDQLFQCEHPWNCPHGRPTLVRTPKRKIDEWFQRAL